MSQRSLMIPLLLIFGLCAVHGVAPAWGQASVSDAEHVRLAEEMNRLAKRNAWKGVEQAFVQLESLAESGTILTYQEYYLGAQAARALGSINQVYTRLNKAINAPGSDSPGDVISWINDIDASYGRVILSTPKKRTGVTLTITQMPFAPDKRSAIEAAQAEVALSGSYRGLLPAGEYQYGNAVLQVVAGEDLTHQLQEEKAAKEAFHLAYVGPRLSLGASYLGAFGDAEIEGDACSDCIMEGFGGGGPRLGAGLELGMSEHLGIFGEIGFQGMYSDFGTLSSVAEGGANSDSSGSSLSFGYAAVGASLRSGKLGFSVSPTVSIGSGKLVYVAEPDEDGMIPFSGHVATSPILGGLSAGISYGVLELGNLQGALALSGGGQTDQNFIYTWGQVAFMMLPAIAGRE